MRHAVVLFSGREGSSAILSHLRRHPRIAVPLFEELDHYMLVQELAPELHCHLPSALRRTFRTGRYEPAFFAPGSGEELPDSGRHTAFKWRGWNLEPPVAEAFAAEDAGIFLLNRRDLLNLALSLYFTREVIGGGTLVHPQFLLFRMPLAERPGYLADLRSRHFPVDPEVLARDMRGFIGEKQRVVRAMRVFAAAGVPAWPVWYEDFAREPRPFLAGMLDRLGLDMPPEVLETEYVKVSREDMREQVENLAELEAAPGIREQVERWQETCAMLEALAAREPAEAAAPT